MSTRSIYSEQKIKYKIDSPESKPLLIHLLTSAGEICRIAEIKDQSCYNKNGLRSKLQADFYLWSLRPRKPDDTPRDAAESSIGRMPMLQSCCLGVPPLPVAAASRRVSIFQESNDKNKE